MQNVNEITIAVSKCKTIFDQSYHATPSLIAVKTDSKFAENSDLNNQLWLLIGPSHLRKLQSFSFLSLQSTKHILTSTLLR